MIVYTFISDDYTICTPQHEQIYYGINARERIFNCLVIKLLVYIPALFIAVRWIM